jgi:hypothetical protein
MVSVVVTIQPERLEAKLSTEEIITDRMTAIAVN